MAAATIAKLAGAYAFHKLKGPAFKVGKKITKKGVSAAAKAIRKYVGSNKKAKAALGALGALSESTAPVSKPHKEMIEKGITKEKETQSAAYTPKEYAESKLEKAAAELGGKAHASKKLMTEGRALSYKGEATKKTRR